LVSKTNAVTTPDLFRRTAASFPQTAEFAMRCANGRMAAFPNQEQPKRKRLYP